MTSARHSCTSPVGSGGSVGHSCFVVVEQNLEFVETVAEDVLVMDHGEAVPEGHFHDLGREGIERHLMVRVQPPRSSDLPLQLPIRLASPHVPIDSTDVRVISGLSEIRSLCAATRRMSNEPWSGRSPRLYGTSIQTKVQFSLGLCPSTSPMQGIQGRSGVSAYHFRTGQALRFKRVDPSRAVCSFASSMPLCLAVAVVVAEAVLFSPCREPCLR